MTKDVTESSTAVPATSMPVPDKPVSNGPYRSSEPKYRFEKRGPNIESRVTLQKYDKPTPKDARYVAPNKVSLDDMKATAKRLAGPQRTVGSKDDASSPSPPSSATSPSPPTTYAGGGIRG